MKSCGASRRAGAGQRREAARGAGQRREVALAATPLLRGAVPRREVALRGAARRCDGATPRSGGRTAIVGGVGKKSHPIKLAKQGLRSEARAEGPRFRNASLYWQALG